MIRVLYSKSIYIIILLLIGIVILLLKLNSYNNTTNISIDFFVSSNSNNGCLSLYINDDNVDNEYSFDNGMTWQNSKYGAIYQNGNTKVLVKNKNGIVIFEKEIEVNNISLDAPVIKLDFDRSINNKSNSELLKGVTATYNNKDILSSVKTTIKEDNNDKILVSYIAEYNGKTCYLLRNIDISLKEETKTIKWVWPVKTSYEITRGVSNSHNGVDIYGPKRGSLVYAAMDGKVVEISANSSSGYYVTIKHNNGYYSRYVHLQNTDGTDKLAKVNSALKYIKIGQNVKASDIIGEVGASGNSTAIHLHYEVWDGMPFKGKLLDPLSFYK